MKKRRKGKEEIIVVFPGCDGVLSIPALKRGRSRQIFASLRLALSTGQPRLHRKTVFKNFFFSYSGLATGNREARPARQPHGPNGIRVVVDALHT